jgi:hypothetical protein
MNHLKLTLQENARSFLEDALQNAIAAERRPDRWKFAVLSLVQAIELILKQVLFKVHPLFVYVDVDKATKTVGLDHAIKRLSIVTKLEISTDEREALRTAKQARDQIIHYEVDQNVEYLKLSFARLLGFLADFHTAHLDTPLYDRIDKNLWIKGLAIREYGQELHERAMKRVANEVQLTEYDATIACPACSWRPMVVLEDGESNCYVCGYKTRITFCKRCDTPFESHEEDQSRDNHCKGCFEYVSDDYWYEHRAGK